MCTWPVAKIFNFFAVHPCWKQFKFIESFLFWLETRLRLNYFFFLQWLCSHCLSQNCLLMCCWCRLSEVVSDLSGNAFCLGHRWLCMFVSARVSGGEVMCREPFSLSFINVWGINLCCFQTGPRLYPYSKERAALGGAIQEHKEISEEILWWPLALWRKLRIFCARHTLKQGLGWWWGCLGRSPAMLITKHLGPVLVGCPCWAVGLMASLHPMAASSHRIA